MEPTLAPGDRLLVAPWDGAARRLARGALVVLDDPEASGRRLIKRIAGLPGEIVWTVPSGIIVREFEGRDPETERPPDAVERTVVPVDRFFVMSERPEGGRDSRRFGPVAQAAIQGVAWYRYHPPGRRGPIGPAPEATRGSPRP